MARDNRVRIRAELENAVSKGLHGIRADLDATAKSPGAKSLLLGAGMAAGAMAWNAIGGAVSGVVGWLGEAVDAAREDERSIAALTASLRANAPAWDGNSESIEAAILARQRLGFADEDLRGSLQLGVAATHDVAEALKLQSVAMDLARFKGIDVKTATEALVKVEAGQYRMLKALGIELRDGATATEALAAVQAVASGQAKAYANTLEGRAEVATIRSAEAQERFGKALAPIATGLQELAAGALEAAAEGFGVLTEAMGEAAAVGAEVSGIRMPSTFVERTRALGVTAAEVGPQVRTFASDAGTLAGELRELGYGAGDADKALHDLAGTISDEVFGDAINAGHLADLQQQRAELVKQREDVKEGSREWRRLTGEIAANNQAQFELRLTMAEKDGPAAVIAFLDEAEVKYGKNNTKLAAMIANLRSVWTLLQRFDDLGTIDFGRYSGKIIPGMAEGGIVKASPGGTIVRIGEGGHDEAVVPLASSGARAALGPALEAGTPVELVLQLDGDTLARIVDRRLYFATGHASPSRLHT